MKRIFAFLMCAIVFMSAFGMVSGITVFAEEAEATLWNPYEITLESTKKYDQPYMDVDVDAVFTHEDGTVITRPGFWKEDKTWAVRFSPPKTGKWSYVITCSDTSNKSLTATGEIIAKGNDGSTEIEKHGFISVKEGQRYYTYADGTPFFWLGDTNWQAPNYVQTTACNYPGCTCNNQFKHEVDNRVAKNFNVYQTYFDSSMHDGGGQRGKLKPIWSESYTEPNTEVFNNKIDYMFEYLHSQGMTIALGMGVHTITTTNMVEDDLLRFARYVVARYGAYSIVWITAQEMTDNTPSKTPGKTCFEVWMSMASYVEQLDGYKHPNSAHMYGIYANHDLSVKLDRSEWHDSWTLQQGHAHVISKSFYKGYYYNLNGKIKPFIESEANYEDINCGGFTGYNLNRNSAWHSTMNGSAGFTYGVAGIWANCFSNEGNTGWFGPNSYSYEPWYMGLDKPGSYEVGYMKRFYENLPDWTKLVPRYENGAYSSFGSQHTKSIASTNDGKTIVCYFFNQDTSTGSVLNIANGTFKALWYNPLTGKYVEIGEVDVINGSYNIPEKPNKQDWAFVMTQEELKPYETETLYKDVETDKDNTIKGNIVTPAKVTAIGGIYSVGGRRSDQTSLLYDLNGTTPWEPLADRVSQTIIYDLGIAYDVTHMAIVPSAGTVLPNYRIEGSLDGKSWTIIANACIRDKRMSKDGTYISEALSGAYRYIKLILVNSSDIPAEEADKKDYMVTFNESQNIYYSHTAISEISVFASGISDIKAETQPTATPDVKGEEITKEEGIKPAISIAIIAGGAVLGVAVGVLVGTKIKKKQ